MNCKVVLVLIESDWNLKGSDLDNRQNDEGRINRIRLEFKAL